MPVSGPGKLSREPTGTRPGKTGRLQRGSSKASYSAGRRLQPKPNRASPHDRMPHLEPPSHGNHYAAIHTAPAVDRLKSSNQTEPAGRLPRDFDRPVLRPTKQQPKCTPRDNVPMAIERHYNPIDVSTWRRIKESARANGIDINSDRGQANLFGVSLKWEWLREHLTVTVSSPAIPEEQALAYIDGIIRQSRL